MSLGDADGTYPAVLLWRSSEKTHVYKGLLKQFILRAQQLSALIIHWQAWFRLPVAPGSLMAMCVWLWVVGPGMEQGPGRCERS